MVRLRDHRGRAEPDPGLADQLCRHGARLEPLRLDLVQPSGQAFRESSGVGEDQRGVLLFDQPGDPFLHVRPDRGAVDRINRRGAHRVIRLGRTGQASLRDASAGQIGPRGARNRDVGAGELDVGRSGPGGRLRHVFDRHHDAQIPLLGLAGLDDPHRGAEPVGDGLGRPYGGGQTDPLGRGRQQRVQPLQGERQVRAPFRAGDRVHLVDDHRSYTPQRLPSGRGEQQEQRLRGGDQDVRRAATESAALLGGSVPGPDRYLDRRLRLAPSARGLGDPGQRRAQVALHVHRQRFQR